MNIGTSFHVNNSLYTYTTPLSDRMFGFKGLGTGSIGPWSFYLGVF